MESFVTDKMQLALGIGGWTACSVGMLVFNKIAISAFPVSCMLVAIQMGSAAVFLSVFCWSTIHIGSRKDVLRWSMVIPFFTGMLLTSILALKHAPMSLVVTFRSISPFFALIIEQFYPNPIRVTASMVFSMALMIFGVFLYTFGSDVWYGRAVFWVFMNNFFAVGYRLLQRLMLASDQSPVDISKTGVTLLNNLLGMIPLFVVALLMKEYEEVPSVVAKLTPSGGYFIAASCIVGIGISYSAVWVQSHISTTSFLMLVNSNNFVILFIEVYVMHTKQLTPFQILGASVSIIASILYGMVRDSVAAKEEAERKALLPKASKAAEDLLPKASKA